MKVTDEKLKAIFRSNDYTTNVPKYDTCKATAADNFKALHDVIDYDMNGDNTEQSLYVTVINCLPETACERMMSTTKRQFRKTDGVLAYHAYCYPKNNVTFELCKSIKEENKFYRCSQYNKIKKAMEELQSIA